MFPSYTPCDVLSYRFPINTQRISVSLFPFTSVVQITYDGVISLGI